jgi:DNA-binding MarR family transcriptional regulator
MHSSANPEWDQIRKHIREQVRMLFGIEESSGMELFFLLQSVAHLSRMLDGRLGDDKELSGPRWRLLLRLLIEERRGDSAGCTPTELSQSQFVGKNTISALLRGLEAQGLIQRKLDAADLRTFRIQLTQSGREYLRGAAPARVENLNRLFSGLDREEQARFTDLLERLRRSLLQYRPAWKTEEFETAGAAEAPLTEESISQ